MKGKKYFLFVVVATVFIIIACSGFFTAELYLRDILDIEKNPNSIYFTAATIEMESPGGEDTEKLKGKLSEWFRDAQNFRETERSYSTYLVADIKIPVMHAKFKKVDNTQDLISLIVEEGGPAEIHFGYRLDKEVFRKISDYVSDEFYTSVSIQDWDFSVILKNDTREKQKVILQSVYANQEPVLFPKEFVINDRSSIELSFPDILRDYTYEKGEVLLFTLLK